jgi:tetratricopeptide (TPR) repeat protein
VAQDHLMLGAVLGQAGDPQAGLREQQRGLDLLEEILRTEGDEPQILVQVARAYDRQADTLVRLGARPAALDRLRRSAVFAERALAQDPGNAALRRALALTCYKLGDLLRGGRGQEARTAYERSRKLLLSLQRQAPLPAEDAALLATVAGRLAAAAPRRTPGG